MNNFYKIIIFVFYLFSVTDAKSASCTTTKDGDFNDPAVWSCGSVPDKNDDVTVNHDINFNVSFTGGNATKGVWVINASGKLRSSSNDLEVASTGTLTINGIFESRDLTFKNGSTITISSSSPSRVYRTLTNSNNSNNVTINSELLVDGDFNNNNNAVVTGTGSINVSGNFSNASTGTVFGCTGTGCNCSNCILSTTTLPVELLSFTATLTSEQKVKLEWSTAVEINNDYFTVEKSTNGLTFFEIGKIKGSGNSNQKRNYELTDNSPESGVTYYRLKQTDYDGKFEYFEVVSVSYYKNNDGSCTLKVYPNPCSGKCNIELNKCPENSYQEIIIDVVDAAGNKITSQMPYRNSDGSFQFHINNENTLAPGLYIIKASSLKEEYNKKMIVK